MQKVTPLDISELIARLRKKTCRGPKGYDKENPKTLGSSTVRTVYDLLKNFFDKTIEWGVRERDTNPVTCERPSKPKSNRTKWTRNQIRAALNDIQDPVLHLAVHTAMFCSARNGETTGLTWDCIHFDDVAFGTIRINKTLQRVSKKALCGVAP